MLLSQNMMKGNTLTTSVAYLVVCWAADRMAKYSWAEETQLNKDIPSPLQEKPGA